MAKGLSHTARSGRTRIPAAETRARHRLVQLFRRNGYIRVPHDERREELGKKYKKGWEVRLALSNEEELREVRSLLHQVGLKRRNPFTKGSQLVQPIYGKRQVESFLGWNTRYRGGQP